MGACPQVPTTVVEKPDRDSDHTPNRGCQTPPAARISSDPRIETRHLWPRHSKMLRIDTWLAQSDNPCFARLYEANLVLDGGQYEAT